MYRIGEFSKITNLTIKALRYYDDENILKPSFREENNYRLYTEEDFKKAQLIVFLRSVDFSISEIKEVIASCESEEDLKFFLSEKRAFVIDKINKEKDLVKAIDQHLGQARSAENKRSTYNIEVKEIPQMKVAAIGYLGAYSEVNKYVGTLYKAAKNLICGPMFNCYHDAEFKEDAQIELCVPVKANFYDPQVIVKDIPPIRAISVVHHGPYTSLNLGYKILLDYAFENSLECALPSREIYHKGPGMIFKGNPDKYVTEIVIPTK